MNPADTPATPRLRTSDLPDDDAPPVAAASREITQDTPLASLTQAEIAALNERMLNETNSASRDVLIGPISPIAQLRHAYLDGSPSVLRQIDWLEEKGYTHYRAAARDGNCFYRSFAFCYLDRILHAPNLSSAVARFRDVLSSIEFSLELAFEDDSYKEFSEQLNDLINLVAIQGSEMTTEDLLGFFLEVTDYVSYFFRLVASAEIRSNTPPYSDFIIDQDVVSFCQSQIEAVSSEADHLAIMALCNALRVSIKLAALNAHLPDGKIHEAQIFTDIAPENAMDKDLPPIMLLFRPGHYDILLKPR
ncbi:OTU domain-containing protein [Mycena indigotica]|uniref:ubiquitinyl hydrolase 1 n=1 Tax=Mycena indigotica TaxID=2126181 RepID=A0A8H6TA95_9AGAR|nr:OTU domain-containing protein [Mycena indigotica]KAF7315050.1 OTU domain-containing protein [Mycena indigotica]